jgi:hypothetical protein
MRLEWDAIHCTHPTVGLLLLNIATLLSVRVLHTCSIISHNRTSPTSSRSEFVSFPVGFESVFTLAVISGGHWRHCRGQSYSSPMMTLPTPWLEASTTLTKLGQPGTSFQHHVGRVVDSRKIVQQLAIACQSGFLRWKYTMRGCRLSSLLHGEKRPHPPGRAMNACCSISSTDSWNGIPWS